jgi:dTDP-4-dehydrorhamnose reductase
MEREVVRVVADQYGCPTCSKDLAGAILAIAISLRDGEQRPWGTYHYCGEGVTTWHGFAEAILDLAGQHAPLKVKRIEPVTTAEYPTPAKRPAYSVLDCSRIRETFAVKPRPWRESLTGVIRELLSNERARVGFS